MKHDHRRPVSTSVLTGFEVVNGTPPGPTDPGIAEILPPPQFRRVGGHAMARPVPHCRARSC
jgi:hypothetical protein